MCTSRVVRMALQPAEKQEKNANFLRKFEEKI